MLFLQKFFFNKTFSTLTLLHLLALVHTKVISDCAAVTSGNAEYIENTNTACNSLYPFIYCNSTFSAYCTQEKCLEEYECTSAELLTAAPTSRPSIATAASPIPSGAPIITTTSPTTSSVTTTSTTASEPSSAANTATTMNIRKTCQTGITGNYPYPRNCRYYYRCIDGYYLLQDCGFRMSFDAIDRFCKSTKVAQCLQETRNESFW
ncbi:chondroitin proteoglycan 1-like [Anastrepha obliqua]|uniref:chondroitin proteoglycan 1-like n=1 Tax=Anastrepha obliqua TaxID=95512 RepID=UPI00240A3AF5|nr:chondroitin proteoglycan 1-like [Anastrepha obliqua]